MEGIEGAAAEFDRAEARRKLAVWKAARRSHADAVRRAWQVNLILGPLSFAGLVWLAETECPWPMHFVALGGASLAMLLLWFHLGGRCQFLVGAALRELSEAEAALGQRPLTVDNRSQDRLLRFVLAALFVLLWLLAWQIRPDCSVPAEEEGDLAAYSLSHTVAPARLS